MPRENRRAERVAEAIREEVASYLTGGVKDPRVTGFVTVTGVDLTSDLRHAKVYVSILGENVNVDDVIEGLNAVGNRIKGEVGRALRLRLAPEIVFKRDESFARASRIESLLAQIKHDTPPRDD